MNHSIIPNKICGCNAIRRTIKATTGSLYQAKTHQEHVTKRPKTDVCKDRCWDTCHDSLAIVVCGVAALKVFCDADAGSVPNALMTHIHKHTHTMGLDHQWQIDLMHRSGYWIGFPI